MSTVWKYADKIDKTSAKCKICFKVYKFCGNTSNMMKHLKASHPHLTFERNSDSECPTQPQLVEQIADMQPIPNPIARGFELGAANKEGGSRHAAIILTDLFADWGVDKSSIMAVLTDNGANMVAAVKVLFGDGKKHLPCFAHTINLVAEKVEATSGMPELVQKVREIVKFFKKSVLATATLKKAQANPKKVILDVKTRWNSCFYMMQRFVELAPFISPILLKDLYAPHMLSAAELNNIKELLNILKPLEFITRELSGEKYVTISKVIPLINCLVTQVSALEENAPVCAAAKKVLPDQIQYRFGQIEHVPIIAISTMLDPRFKNLHFRSAEACGRTIALLKSAIAVPPSVTSSESESDEPTRYSPIGGRSSVPPNIITAIVKERE
ncbi:PREDICTED: zinc finger BED domain-containing protein 4-like [Rhagoletis zephyria]|uniref:zinc finger BED domain-containing protein 4-like n=1 Tax=Rhagoletis zephyria TaxID=28612 RepID=UPI0008114038|nr:PREDICTED: zinc finger BED domain-containing protein 4-like [Rhagoletis zephyria]